MLSPPSRRLAVLSVLSLAFFPVAVRAEDRVEYNRDIRPILSDNCFLCHGPDKARRKAKLRLDVRDEAVGKAITPGKPDESSLIERVFAADADHVMPPPKSNKVLTAEQKALLKRWVAEGAVYQEHWAYEKVVKSVVPKEANGVDFLVRQHQAKKQLQPSPEADRRILARRLHLDLLGLPPKPEDVEAFVNDRRPDAYEKLVDKLLASPHYGERMALGWLDVVRFADTIGYHSDNPRNVWPFRDYVIRSFNDNKPFDRFTIEQLAGDLLPDSTREQKVASCFNRLLLTTEEGGAQSKDYEARMLTDRVRAVGTVWLGQTLGCCQCHDHKFDPTSARDFYAMGAFFADVEESIIGRREPGLLVPDELQQAELTRLQARVAETQKELDGPHPELTEAQTAWEQAVTADQDKPIQWNVLQPTDLASEQGVGLTADQDGVIQATKDSRDGTDIYRITVKGKWARTTAFRLEVLADEKLPAKGPGRAGNGNFVLNEVRVLDEAGKPIPLAGASATFEQTNFPARNVLVAKGDKKQGWALSGKIGTDQALTLDLAKPIAQDGETKLVFVLRQQYGEQHIIGRFRLSATTHVAAPPADIAAILRIDPTKRDDGQKEKLRKHFASTAAELNELRSRLAEARKVATAFEETLPHCLVTTARGTPRTVRLLPRGNWMDDSGTVMKPAYLHYLPHPDEPADRRLNRLDLARWIVSRDNPLTARVFVNRLWKQFYGAGLSRSLDDLGSQGEPPSNLELLDWLAAEFMENGWNVKKLVRTIVTSQTYRQVSTVTKELQSADPFNREFARQGRFRLDAELVRDNALSISGLLVRKVGGPSVKPYQPEGYWENLNFPQRQYVADRDENEYRRGLYTWWQRSFVHPSMLAFDAPTREECAADRARSNIPQQALVLLNDPTYVEAARAFAVRILQQGDKTDEARLRWAWKQALGREPRAEELATARRLVEKHLAQYKNDHPAAEALLKTGFAPLPADLDPTELAAWTNLARVVLNLHETITRF